MDGFLRFFSDIFKEIGAFPLLLLVLLLPFLLLLVILDLPYDYGGGAVSGGFPCKTDRKTHCRENLFICFENRLPRKRRCGADP